MSTFTIIISTTINSSTKINVFNNNNNKRGHVDTILMVF